MPIFEFECTSCGNKFEELVLPWLEKTAAVPACPSCKGQDVQRVLSICAVSSESTRGANLKGAQKRASKTMKERDDAENKRLAEHAKEHH